MGFCAPPPPSEYTYYYYEDELLSSDELEKIESSIATTTATVQTSASSTDSTTDYPWHEDFDWDWDGEEELPWNNRTTAAAVEEETMPVTRGNSSVGDYISLEKEEAGEERAEGRKNGSGVNPSIERGAHPSSSFKIKVFRME